MKEKETLEEAKQMMITQESILEQIALTEARGEKIVKYLNRYKGDLIYNEIALAIEFGYQLKLEEDEQKQHLIDIRECENSEDWDINKQYRDEFIEGSKWQQENSYSEEDLLLAYMEGGDDESNYKTFYEWFEQFKKK
jgi:hypothetical protein